MKPTGTRAYAYARLRAWKSRLLRREDALPLLAATDAAAVKRAAEVLGVATPFSRLIRIYETAIRADPSAAPLLRALLRLHEIENVKLLWRIVAGHRHRAHPGDLWIPLGSLDTLGNAPARATTPRELADALARTPYAGIAKDVLRAHIDDVAAAEMAFDRWASRQLLDESRKLPKSESLAKRMIELIIRRRDSEIARRGEKWFGLSPGAAQTLQSVPADKRVHATIDLPTLCRRALRGDLFTLAPTVALILLAEAEVRAVRGLIERQGDPALDAPLARAIAGSQLAP